MRRSKLLSLKVRIHTLLEIILKVLSSEMDLVEIRLIRLGRH
jgi:hypothetical protein